MSPDLTKSIQQVLSVSTWRRMSSVLHVVGSSDDRLIGLRGSRFIERSKCGQVWAALRRKCPTCPWSMSLACCEHQLCRSMVTARDLTAFRNTTVISPVFYLRRVADMTHTAHTLKLKWWNPLSNKQASRNCLVAERFTNSQKLLNYLRVCSGICEIPGTKLNFQLKKLSSISGFISSNAKELATNETAYFIRKVFCALANPRARYKFLRVSLSASTVEWNRSSLLTQEKAG